uniref:COMM domain containing 4 n=1 Tax=Canis lupus familiaris TaxID=9615 RepID=A0A8C0TDM3_CANLF
MRFRFCGDLDCPDWVLAEISTLAKISSVKLRLLCSQVLKELLGQGIDYEKILKLTADARFESGDVKATVAVLSFILSSAAKHSVDGESLSSELQQLGLPKEHAASLCRCYEEKQSPLQEHLRACSLRVNRLAGVGWRVDYTLSSSLLRSVEEPMVHLRLEVVASSGAPAQPVAMSLSAVKFQVLLAGETRLYLEGEGASRTPADCHPPAHLFPCRTEAGSDPDEQPGLRRRPPSPLPTAGPAPGPWRPGLLGSPLRTQHKDSGDFSTLPSLPHERHLSAVFTSRKNKLV